MKKEVRTKVWNKFNCKCAYCGNDLKYKDMQVDHIVPKLHFELNGGDGMNDFENLNPSCRACNFYKSSHSLETFRKIMMSIHERIIKSFIAKLGSKYGIVRITPFDGKFYFEQLN